MNDNKNLRSKEFKNFKIEEVKNLGNKKDNDKNSIEELSESTPEVLMGEDIDLSKGRVESQFSFNSNNSPVLNINVQDEDFVKLNINSKETLEENLTVKRSYTLRPSTVKMLQELKVFIYDDPYIKYNDIVDAAIRLFYDYKKQ